jgi:tRNA 2-thiouridine synthesizing protein A
MTDETTELDTKGLYCPEPVMMLHAAVRKANSGALIRVIATDPSTTRDIPKFCQFLGHTLERQEQLEEEYIFEVRKK